MFVDCGGAGWRRSLTTSPALPVYASIRLRASRLTLRAAGLDCHPHRSGDQRLAWLLIEAGLFLDPFRGVGQ